MRLVMPCRASNATVGSAPEFGTAASCRAADAATRPRARCPTREPPGAAQRPQTDSLPHGRGVAGSHCATAPRSAHVPQQRHPVFCGAYGALQCAPEDAATQAMLQTQALAVADPALRGLSVARSDCDPSCGQACSVHHSPASGGADGPRCSAALQDAQQRPGQHCQPQWAHLGTERRVLVGYTGEHVEVAPALLPMWDRVRDCWDCM